MKKILISTIVATSLTLGTTANAGGVPTIDVSNLAQNVQQILKLQDQIKKLQAQLDAIKGATDLGKLLKTAGESMHDLYPELEGSLTNVNNALSASSELKKQVESLRGELQALTAKDVFEDRESIARTYYDEASNQIFANLALNETALTVSNERKKVYERLRSKISDAKDPKEKQDLSLTISVETLQVLNDLVIEMQMDRAMRLNKENVELNEWARSRVIQTKMKDVQLKGD